MADKEQNKSQMIICQAEGGTIKIDVRFRDETVWLTQKLLAKLFQVAVSTINEHVKNIYKEGELGPSATITLSHKFLPVICHFCRSAGIFEIPAFAGMTKQTGLPGRVG